MEKTPAIPTQKNIKQMHLKEIFLQVLGSGGISRAQLRQSLGLSFPSVSALVDELLSQGILYEDGALAGSQRGRPRTQLRVEPRAFVVPVATLSAEGYRCVLFDCTGKPLSRAFLPLDNPQGIEAFSAPLKKWLDDLAEYSRMKALVLTVPGNFHKNGSLSSPILGFATPENFVPLLRARLEMDVVVFNNGDSHAYGELHCQSLPRDFIEVTVGRGVGAGIIRHGKLFSDSTIRAGELGHISIDYRGRPCSCGNRGCLERYINTEVLTAEAEALLQHPAGSLTFEALCSLYRTGDPKVVSFIEEKAALLAVGISNMLAMQPVNHIVIGGKITRLGDAFLDALREAVQTTGLRKYMDRVTLSRSHNTTDPEAFGAFWNYLDHHMTLL